jgi:hypothetical protein
MVILTIKNGGLTITHMAIQHGLTTRNWEFSVLNHVLTQAISNERFYQQTSVGVRLQELEKNVCFFFCWLHGIFVD